MSDFVFIFILFLVAMLSIGISIFYIRRETEKARKGDGGDVFLNFIKQDLREIREEIKEGRESNIKSLESQLKESREGAERQIKESNEIIKEVTEKLTKLDETNKQVVGVAEQFQSLENILRNPKQRGVFGEFYLEEILKNVFSAGQYQMQFLFKDGEIVDAVIFSKEGMIPIDSKFSLENYNRIVQENDSTKKEQLEKAFKQDLKNRIDETAKYIKPQENTTPFAFMYIPTEAVYYDLLVNEIGSMKSNTKDLLEYARAKKVLIVSPNTLFAYLQAVLQGFKAFQIQESIKETVKRVEMLGRHIASYDEYMKKLGSNLSTVINTYNAAYRELNKIDKDVMKIANAKKSVEPLQIDKPSLD